MGRYLEAAGVLAGKADKLIELGATEIDGPPASLADVPEGQTLVCVVENRAWDAACHVRDQYQFDVCRDPSDPRPKRWLLMDKEYVEANAK